MHRPFNQHQSNEPLSIKRRMFAILWRQRGNIHNSSSRVILLRYVGENCETILRKPKASTGELTQIHTSYVNQESGVGLPADKNNDILIEKVQKLACTVYNLNNFIPNYYFLFIIYTYFYSGLLLLPVFFYS